MTPDRPPDPLAELLRRALEPADIGDHPFADDDLAARWADDLLDEDEASAFAAHLAGCRACRDRAAALAGAGLSSPAPRRPTGVWRGAAAAALAAGLLLAVGAVGWVATAPGRELAALEADAAAGRWAEALAAAERLPPDRLAGDGRRRRERGAEYAAYELARGELLAGRFDAARDARDRAERAGARSGRLENVRIRAERKEPAELSFAGGGTLMAYGVAADGGRLPSKLMPAVAPALAASLAAAAAEFPDSPELRASRGAYLLSQRKYADAEAEFRAAAGAADRAGYRTGLGLAIFLAGPGRAAEALAEFRAAAALDPASPAAAANVAVALDALGRRAESAAAWRAVLAAGATGELAEVARARQ